MPVIIVTTIGIICVVVSFFMVEKEKTESSNGGEETAVKTRITDEYELNEEEIAILQRKVSDKIEKDVKELIYDADNTLSTMTNEKMMAIGDYAVTVCDEIEKNHKEVMFLYSMLNDKEKELKELVVEVDEAASGIKKMNEGIMISYTSSASELNSEEDIVMETVHERIQEEENVAVDDNNLNATILAMKKNGKGIMEIARELGLGVGEVKLVVDLYQENAG